MLAQTGELDVTGEDQAVVLLGEQRRPNRRFRCLLISLGKEGETLPNASWRLAQTLPPGIFAQSAQEGSDQGFDWEIINARRRRIWALL